jgi:hypothetical protein
MIKDSAMRSTENCQSGVYRPRRYLLTRNEAAFFRVLSVVLDRTYLISCKVRIADIITCDDRAWHKGAANRIAQKHVDFVISRADSSRIVAAIELDDQSHRRPERQERDHFVNALFRQMSIRLIRISARWRYNQEAVAAIFVRAGLTVTGKPGFGPIPKPDQSLRPQCHRPFERKSKENSTRETPRDPAGERFGRGTIPRKGTRRSISRHARIR